MLQSLQWSFGDFAYPGSVGVGGPEARRRKRELYSRTDLGDLGRDVDDLAMRVRTSRPMNVTVVVVSHSAASVLAFLPEQFWSVRVVLGQVNDEDAEVASEVLLGGQVSAEEVRTAPTARGWVLGPESGAVVQPFTALPRSRTMDLWMRPSGKDEPDTRPDTRPDTTVGEQR